LLLSTYALKKEIKMIWREIIVIAFIAYFLTAAFNISYIVSLNNTKNTLFVLLVGIVAASLFFAVEYKQMKYIVIYVVTLYIAATCFADIPIQQKVFNFIAGLILGTVLLSFSRYSYYFKSSHFVQIKELEEKNKEILLLNSQKSEILSFVAHDLRAPLNNIDALSQILLLENGDNSEMKMISSSALQAKNIINDLIEAVKTEQADISKESIYLKSYINNIIHKWEANTARKIEFSQDNEDLNMQANASKLERVIDNLISNAFKFSSSDKPINIAVSKLKNNVLIKVKDFGIGIPVDLQAHVFDQFSKASRKGLLGEKSIGLGLHISHKIIEQHHGELSVSSAENEGTTFTIQLPLKIA
jgi:two-component system sensor histidine kinase VicK